MSKLTHVVVATVVLGLVGSMAMAQASSKPALPAAVEKAFKEAFPNGKIAKFNEEKENGVTVYDIEFKIKDVQHETDISADGTVMEKSIVVEKANKAAMKAITAAAEGGTVGQIERIETLYEAKDGKLTKLDKAKKTYEAELTKGDQVAEVVVDDKGNVVEAPKWVKAKK